MSKATLSILRLTRAAGTSEDTLEFRNGVNVIAGEDNTGKTKWLQMLDYLFGDTGTASDAFGELAEKYDSLNGLVRIGEKELLLERRWKERGSLHKVYVNGEDFASREFGDFLLEELGTPRIHFPKGNPYEERAWPQLTWRQLVRHIYRQGRFWSDIADRQPEPEQVACILQFLGLAEKVFPQELGMVVDERRRLYRLEARKEQFEALLDQVSSELLHSDMASAIATTATLDQRIQQWSEEREALMARRLGLLESVRNPVDAHREGASTQAPEDVRLGEQRIAAASELQSAEAGLQATMHRLDEVETHYRSVRTERNRLERTQISAAVLADLQVSNCPVCDQQVETNSGPPDLCYLCHRPYSSNGAVQNRLEFEMQQLDEEARELAELLESLKSEQTQLESRIQHLREEIDRLERTLEPVRQNVALMLPPELGTLDAERGRLEERIVGAGRLKNLLRQRDELSKEIDRLGIEVRRLQETVDEKGEAADFTQASDALTDGMNTYYNALNQLRPGRWDSGRVSLKLAERRFTFTIGGRKWSSVLGETLVCVFLLGYHYGLLRLSREPDFNYPGLCIIDFPPELAGTRGTSLNYLVEPFVRLLSEEAMAPCQLIVAGQQIRDIEDTHQIELHERWL